MTYLHSQPLTSPQIFPPAAPRLLETPAELRPDMAGLSFAPATEPGTETVLRPAEIFVPAPGPFPVSALRLRVRVMIMLFCKIITSRGGAGLAQKVKAALRQLYREDKDVMCVWAKRVLRRRPDWQARVFEDLGGEAGLSRWRARLCKFYEIRPEDDPDNEFAWLDDDPSTWPILETPERKARPSKSARKIHPRFKTDRDGLFRWASLKLGRHIKEGPAHIYGDWAAPGGDPANGGRAPKTARPRNKFPGPWPIELLPADLMDIAEEEYLADIDSEFVIEVGGEDRDILPALDPITVWQALQAEHNYLHKTITAAARKLKPNRAAPLLVPP